MTPGGSLLPHVRRALAYVRRTWWSAHGALGVVLFSGAFVAAELEQLPIAVVFGTAWAALFLFERVRNRSASGQLQRALGATRTKTAESWQITGTHEGVPFDARLAFVGAGMLHATLPRSCGFTLASGASTRLVGDAAFDAAFAVSGDEAAWRIALTAELRERLVSDLAGAQLDDNRLSIGVVAHVNGRELERIVRAACEVASGIGCRLEGRKGRRAALLAQVAKEPIATVRRGHFEWLIAKDVELARVLLVASQDPDPSIQAWARAQQPPGSEYR